MMSKMTTSVSLRVLLLFSFLLVLVGRVDVSVASAGSVLGSSPVRISGWFTIIWGDGPPDAPATTELYYLIDDDRSVRLLVDEPQLQALGGSLTLNQRRVTVEGNFVLSPSGEGDTPALMVHAIQPEPAINQADVSATVTGSQPWVSILCKFSDEATEPETVSYFQGMYSNSYPGLDHYWREVSYDTINLVGSGVFGWFTLPHSWSYYHSSGQTNLSELFADCTAAADASVYFPNYVGINMMFNASFSPNYAWGGTRYASLDGVTRLWNVTWEPPWGYRNITVIAHEMGHGLGLPHSSGQYGQTYDNEWDIMSGSWANCSRVDHPTYGCLAQHTVSYHKDRLGWIPGGEKYVAAGGQATIQLEQLALPQTNNYKMIQIPINGSTSNFYTVEVRRQVGYDYKLPGQAVVVHEVDTTRTRPAQVIDVDGDGDTGDAGAMWLVGETFSPGGGISVRVDAATATGFVVTVIAPGLAAPSDLSASAISAGQIDLTWSDNSDDESGFKIERSLDGSNWIQIATVGVNVTGYASTGLSCNTLYYYRVRAYSGGANSGYSNTANATTQSCVPVMPSNLQANGAFKDRMMLSWQDNSSNESGFRIYKWVLVGSQWEFVFLAGVGANVTSFTELSLSCESSHTYAVSAYNSYGESSLAPWVEGQTASCLQPDPLEVFLPLLTK